MLKSAADNVISAAGNMRLTVGMCSSKNENCTNGQYEFQHDPIILNKLHSVPSDSLSPVRSAARLSGTIANWPTKFIAR